MGYDLDDRSPNFLTYVSLIDACDDRADVPAHESWRSEGGPPSSKRSCHLLTARPSAIALS